MDLDDRLVGGVYWHLVETLAPVLDIMVLYFCSVSSLTMVGRPSVRKMITLR